MEVSYKVRWSEYIHEWCVYYYIDGFPDYEVRGTHGLGMKSFPTKEQAVRSGKHYVKSRCERGFTAREDSY